MIYLSFNILDNLTKSVRFTRLLVKTSLVKDHLLIEELATVSLLEQASTEIVDASCYQFTL